MKRSLVVLFVLALSLSGFAHAQCAAFPCVVASISVTDQKAPVSPTALFTPEAGGLFRLTFYLESSHVRGSLWGTSFNWTDDLEKTATSIYWAYPGKLYTATLNVRSIAGQPIFYQVRIGNYTPPDASYNLFITVEQLQ